MESVAVMVNAADLQIGSTYMLGSTIKFRVLTKPIETSAISNPTYKFYHCNILRLDEFKQNIQEEVSFGSEQEFQLVRSGGRRRKSRKARRAQKKRTRRSRR
jgi:hypothetical protein